MVSTFQRGKVGRANTFRVSLYRVFDMLPLSKQVTSQIWVWEEGPQEVFARRGITAIWQTVCVIWFVSCTNLWSFMWKIYSPFFKTWISWFHNLNEVQMQNSLCGWGSPVDFLCVTWPNLEFVQDMTTQKWGWGGELRWQYYQQFATVKEENLGKINWIKPWFWEIVLYGSYMYCHFSALKIFLYRSDFYH